MTQLTSLSLCNNQISDISALVSNAGIGIGDWVYLEGNPLSCCSMINDIPTLEARGATVYWDDTSDECLIVSFPDPNLEAAIRGAISRPSGPIYDDDVWGLESLSATDAGITDLAGLEYCGDLTCLDLSGNDIDDLTVLEYCANLTELYLSDNQISDIGPLAGLTDLRELGLSGNEISDTAPLEDLTNLTVVWLCDNPLECSEISSLIPAVCDDCEYDEAPHCVPEPAPAALYLAAMTVLALLARLERMRRAV
jgi:Leucine-rich repeat (LRR) protein